MSAKLPTVEFAAIAQFQIVRGQRTQAANRIAQRIDFFVAHVFAEETRHVAVGARMRLEFQEHAFGFVRTFIRAERHPRLRQTELHVFLRHQEIHRADARVVFDDEIDRGFLRRLAAHLRHFRERFAGERLEFFVVESDQQQVVRRAGGEHQIFPILARFAHFLDDAFARRRILQTLHPRIDAAFLHPRRHRRVEAGRAGRVCIHVRRNIEAGFARRVHLVDRLRHLGPVGFARGLEVIDLARACALRDRCGSAHRPIQAGDRLRCAYARCSRRRFLPRPWSAR